MGFHVTLSFGSGGEASPSVQEEEHWPQGRGFGELGRWAQNRGLGRRVDPHSKPQLKHQESPQPAVVIASEVS